MWLFTNSLLLVHLVVIFIGIKNGTAIELKAYISQQGLHGTISFSTSPNNDTLILKTDLTPTLEFPSQIWSWFITEFPTDYSETEENRCTFIKLGKPMITLDDTLGYLIIPDNGTSEFETQLKISGEKGIFGKGLLLRNVETRRQICASISLVEKSNEKLAVGNFRSPIAGDIYFRWFSTKNNEREMLITSDLYHTKNVEKWNKTLVDYTEHSWKIYVTDILETGDDNEVNCNSLQLVFDPENNGNGKAIGDIDLRAGKLRISTDYNRNQYKMMFRDERLNLFPGDLTGPQRRLFLVVFENKHPDSFLACAKIRYYQPVVSKVIIESGGIKGFVTLTQQNKFEPTFIDFNLTTARGDLETQLVYSSSVSTYKIHELPINPPKTIGQVDNVCFSTKFVYNPTKLDLSRVPPNGFGTQDQYAIGDLSGKHLNRNNVTQLIPGAQILNGEYWDVFLPLIGENSIVHRSLVIYKKTQYPNLDSIKEEPWICGSVNLYEPNFKYQRQIFSAQVLFRYPLVGRILLRQPRDEPWADTTILVEYLVHADGSTLNNSMNHRWGIHENPPGKDFYNWTARCKSAGATFNPYKIDFNNNTPSEGCSMNSIGMCRMGDLSTRLGTLDIAGKKADSDKISRKLFTDPHLPLTGPNNVLGKSFVMFDDFGPVARGERLACSIIGGVYRRKAVVRDWFGNGVELSVKGKIEFFQQTEYDITNVEVGLDGLEDNSGYHVHVTPVNENLEFPCEGTSLYDHWNPLNVDPSSSPRIYQGTPDQYEMGDLSGKFGTLDNHTLFRGVYNDTMLPLFGPRSIIGRSVIIHKRIKNERWACSTIERGYSPSEARELRAIASFHHPNGYAYGYMKMTQLVYNDGSMSDTIIEVSLRYPGVNDRNVTRDHHWAVFVNPVGVDAAVQTTNTRCVAGGYVWNPFYTQLADPLNQDLYRQECGPENPLRCYVGDLSSRLGTIDIGLKRAVFTESNLPLEGPVNTMGRSIVIKGPNKGPERYACANIEPDYDIIKYVNIEKPPRFVLAQFIEDVRHILGIPEWMLTVDSRKTKTLHSNACIQFLLHFKGPIASKLELDFSKLLTTGRLDSPSLYIPGYINSKRKSKISYQQCSVKDPNDKKSKKKNPFRFVYGSANKFLPKTIYLFVAIVFITYCI